MNVKFSDLDDKGLQSLCGADNKNIKYIEKFFDVHLLGHAGDWQIEGKQEAKVEQATQALTELAKAAHKGDLSRVHIQAVLNEARHGYAIKDNTQIILHAARKRVHAKTLNQQLYVHAIQEHTLTLAAGPAGSGKTYLAVAAAVHALMAQQVDRIILSRPAVEAGEKLGFLPGDLKQKLDPYLRPLFDALSDFLGFEKMNTLIESGIIEVAPLAYMRGRTLNDAFVILDEAQNTTRAQMKMLLTRLGFASKMVVTGDITQIDLPQKDGCGLVHALHVLGKLDDVAICRLSGRDVVRHPLVERMVRAYEKAEKNDRISL
ncbi:MAG: PhoH family protein [Mariprofundales bacterium]